LNWYTVVDAINGVPLYFFHLLEIDLKRPAAGSSLAAGRKPETSNQ